MVEALWGPMPVMLERRRRGIPKMGDRSEPFGRGAWWVVSEDPLLEPVDLDLYERDRDLASHDVLALRRTGTDRRVEKLTDTDAALASDITAAALRDYARLKLNGTAAGLDGLRRDLGRRF